MTVSRGQPLAISCNISSGPPASITWQRDGEELPINSRYHILESQLLITDASPEDAGTYRCIATNQLANRSRASHLGKLDVVSAAEERAGLLPLHHAAQVAAPRGSRVALPCAVLGWPRPKLVWKLAPPHARIRELEETDEVLILRSLEVDQEGVYTCSVEGHANLMKGLVVTGFLLFNIQTFNVTVTEPVSITLPPTSKEVLRASTVRFNCTAVGRPEPVVTWYKDGRPLLLAGRINLRTSADGSRIELVISGVTSDDAGVYQCFALGGASLASAWAALNVTGAWAAAPGALRCLPRGTRRVALRWQPAAAHVVAYTVDTTPRDKPGVALTGQPHTNTEDVITVQEPLTPYLFQVRAYIPTLSKKNVASDMSESVVCQGQGVPIKLLRLGDAVSVTWRQFAEENPGVVEWILQLRAENSTEERNVTLPAQVTDYTLPAGPEAAWVRLLGSRSRDWLPQDLSLLPWTAAKAADQPPSRDVTAVPREVRVSEVGSHGFTARWRCDEADSSPERYSFKVCIKKVDGAEECQDSYKNSATVDGLQPGSEYEVRIQAVVQDRGVGGAFSDPVKVTTQPEGPWQVGELSYSFVNLSAVVVRWRGAAARYTVRHSARLRLPVEQWAALSTAGTEALVSPLRLLSPLTRLEQWAALSTAGTEALVSPLRLLSPLTRLEQWAALSTAGTEALVSPLRLLSPLTRLEQWAALSTAGTEALVSPLRLLSPLTRLEQWAALSTAGTEALVSPLRPLSPLTRLEQWAALSTAGTEALVSPLRPLSPLTRLEQWAALSTAGTEALVSPLRPLSPLTRLEQWAALSTAGTEALVSPLRPLSPLTRLEQWAALSTAGTEALVSSLRPLSPLTRLEQWAALSTAGTEALVSPLRLLSPLTRLEQWAALSTAGTEALVSPLRPLSPLTRLEQWAALSTAGTEALVSPLRPLSPLTRLEQWAALSTAGTEALVSPLRPLSPLTRLEQWAALSTAGTEALVSSLRPLSPLTRLEQWAALSTAGTEALVSPLRPLSPLTRLEQWAALSTAGTEALVSPLRPLSPLTRLEQWAALSTAGTEALVSSLRPLSPLTRLEQWAALSTAGTEALVSPLRPLSPLTRLEQWAALSTAGTEALVSPLRPLSPLTRLEQWAALSTAGTEALVSPLRPLSPLTRLEQWAALSTAGTEALVSPLRPLSPLTRLEQWAALSTAGTEALVSPLRPLSPLTRLDQWAALSTAGTEALITGIEPTEQTYVMVTGHEPLGHSRILTIPAQLKDLEAKDLSYAYTGSGVRVWWRGAGPRTVRFAQNITRPVEHWASLAVAGPQAELENLDPALPVYVMVTIPGPGKPNQVLTIPPRPTDNYNMYLTVGVGVGVAVLCALSFVAACVWRKYNKNRSPARTRRRNQSPTEGSDEDGSELKEGRAGGVGGRLANGGACGEPLLNGHPAHAHAHSLAPNGKPQRALYAAFDVSRDEHDTTAETTLAGTPPRLPLLDTSRAKLPDDNMNCEHRPQPLQPNG
ncbi:unnamed protein product, partial [Iphiclides podalirius]